MENPYAQQSAFHRCGEDVRSGERPMPGLRQHQRDAAFAFAFADRPNERIGTIVLPTGTGKTGVAVVAAYLCRARCVLVVAPGKEVANQLHAAFCGTRGRREDAFMCRIGAFDPDWAGVVPSFADTLAYSAAEFRAQHNNNSVVIRQAGLQVVNAQKFGANATSVDLDEVNQELFDLVIVDEAHHYPAETWRRIVAHFHESRVMFLTATPNQHLPPPLFSLSREDAVRDGLIRDVRFEELGELAELFQRLQELLQERPGHKAMALTRTIDEAANLAAQLTGAGIGANSFVSNTPDGVLRAFCAADNIATPVLVVCGRLLEGFDLPTVSVVVILRNVGSQVLFTQFVGRAVRRINDQDNHEAVVLSLEDHGQRAMFNGYVEPALAEDHPVDEFDV